MTSSVCALLVVKNEAKGIAETLASLVQGRHLVDAVHVHDTGSEDDTIAIARATCAEVGLPIRVTQGADVHAMGGYSGIYNVGLRNAADLGCEWILHLSGDNTIELDANQNPNAIREACDAAIGFGVGARYVQRRWEPGGLEWVRPLLTKAGWGWWYEGRVHETLVCTRAGSEHLLPLPARRNFTMVYRPRETESDWKARALRDVEWLTHDMAEKPSARTAFYLAQAYHQLDQREQAISWYEDAATHWPKASPEVRYCAAMRLGRLTGRIGWWAAAHEICERPEAAYELAHDYYMRGLGALPPDIWFGHAEYDVRHAQQIAAYNSARLWVARALVRVHEHEAREWRMNVDADLWRPGGKLRQLADVLMVDASPAYKGVRLIDGAT